MSSKYFTIAQPILLAASNLSPFSSVDSSRRTIVEEERRRLERLEETISDDDEDDVVDQAALLKIMETVEREPFGSSSPGPRTARHWDDRDDFFIEG